MDLVVDVGAAVGEYGRALRRNGYEGAIASFEPLRESFDVLVEAARRDRRWTVSRLALSDEVGEAVLNVARNSDSSSLLPMLESHIDAAPHATNIRTETVQTATLDSILDTLPSSSRPFVKIDVQGAEKRVLDGAPEFMKSAVGVQLELSFLPLYESGLLIDEVIDLMRSLDFTLVEVEPGFRDERYGTLLQADGTFLRAGAMWDAR